MTSAESVADAVLLDERLVVESGSKHSGRRATPTRCGRDGVPPPGSLELCKDCLNAQRVGDAEAMEQAMSRLGHLPVAVEMAVGTDGSRRFALPAADAPHATNDDDAASRRRLLEFSELSFGEGGHGHTTWPAGVALAIWLQRNAPFVRGQRVLELGSGVGIAGLSAALAGAAHVTLTSMLKVPTLCCRCSLPWSPGACLSGLLAALRTRGDPPSLLRANGRPRCGS